MRNDRKWMVALAFVVPGLVLIPASGAGAAGKIVCWKDKSGKVVGCGDTVPPEYRTNATKELDNRGVTRKTTESAEEAAKHREQDQALAKQKAEEQKQQAEQRRQDAALLSTFSNAKEIDNKRDRDLQVVDLQISQMKLSLKSAGTAAEKQKVEGEIAAKEKERGEIQQRYAGYRERYIELKGGAQPAAAPAPAARK